MKVFNQTLRIPTQGKGTYEITDQVRQVVEQSQVQSGQVCVFVKHTSCSLIIMENADPSARVDLHAFFDRLVSEDTPYFTHTYEGKDDMPSHIRMCLTGCSEVIPIINAQMTLGTWQGIFLFEHRHHAHTRSIVIQIIGV